MPNPQARILSMAMAEQAVNSQQFRATFPEYAQLVQQMVERKKAPAQKKKCGGCGAAKASLNVFKDFVRITLTLPADKRRQFRNFFGGPVSITAQHRTTGKIQTIEV